MKLSPIQLIFGALLVVGAQAQLSGCAAVAVTAIPQCAQSCFLNGAPSVGCAGLDFNCQCGKEAALHAAIEGCVSTACASSLYQSVIDGASTVCACASSAGGGGGGGANTVSGTVVSGIATVSATATATSGGSGSGGGSGGGIPTTTPSYFASASSVNGANHQVKLGLGVVFSAAAVVAAALVL
ncbi:CFEM domain-containing protein [Diplogelasinospora grovesii]|uniref:CFEM domain-containing protein n=1 Tax=Diplogelasinospora grovesii TaxID=303347 RepID=A0AAN6NA77_9PEZI|nr:CFEM domain-containing protein [Diplogelasinospora grovesii]